jgi:hypothetical protein
MNANRIATALAAVRSHLVSAAKDDFLRAHNIREALSELTHAVSAMPAELQRKFESDCETLGAPIKLNSAQHIETASVSALDPENVAGAMNFLLLLVIGLVSIRDQKESWEMSTETILIVAIKAAREGTNMTPLATEFATWLSTPPEKKTPHLRIVK